MYESIVKNIIKSIFELATEKGQPVCIAVVDDSGLLRGFSRMDGAVAGAIDVSIKKARTAALFATNSLILGQAAQPGGDIYTLENTNGGLISFGGGVVIKDSVGKLIGAVGVAGATLESDELFAQVGAKLGFK